MAFWKFGFTQTNTIEQQLNGLPDAASPLAASILPAYHNALDIMLASPELLTEIKDASNLKLVTFFARPEIIERLAGWVVWGLGGIEFEDDNTGIISDNVEDGKVPDQLVKAGKRKTQGMGGVPRRRDLDVMGALEGGTPETEWEKTRSNFPRLCAELLTCDSVHVGEVLYPEALDPTQSPPADAAFLIPFWETLLKSTELQLESRTVLVGYWARVNNYLLNSSKGPKILETILTIPNLLSRLLALLPICSPLNDLIVTILKTLLPSSPFRITVVPNTLRMLDPGSPLGILGHMTATELFKSIIEASIVPTAPAQPPPGVPSAPPGLPQPGPAQDEYQWRENSLLRQMAESSTIKSMVQWMLDDDPIESITCQGEIFDELALQTSSLVNSITVMVDLIRKNNSDWVERQMLQWAREREAEELEREMVEADRVVPLHNQPKKTMDPLYEQGPSIVNLTSLLEIITENLDGVTRFLKKPRSLRGPISTTNGQIFPLTTERYKICELLAELLHCSNMQLSNRPPEHEGLYNGDGRLHDGWKDVEKLAAALSTPPPTEMDEVTAKLASISLEEFLKTFKPSTPGQGLKMKFLKLRVVNIIIDLFFEFPANNFLHNVIFDILQQIFHGRMDQPLDRQLALSVFLDGKLVHRILEAQAENDSNHRTQGQRLGHMAHLTLIGEETTKFFDHYPAIIYEVVKPHIPADEWSHYVTSVLIATRELLEQPLGGTNIPQRNESTHINSLSDEDDDDEVPSTNGVHQRSESITGEEEPASVEDQFSRYLQNTLAGDNVDRFGSSSSDEDDSDGDWNKKSSPFDDHDADFTLTESQTAPFGFRKASNDDVDWGTLTINPKEASPNINQFEFSDSFANTTFTGFGDSFDDFVTGSTYESSGGANGDDFGDFGDFESAPGNEPKNNDDEMGDFDFKEDNRTIYMQHPIKNE